MSVGTHPVGNLTILCGGGRLSLVDDLPLRSGRARRARTSGPDSRAVDAEAERFQAPALECLEPLAVQHDGGEIDVMFGSQPREGGQQACDGAFRRVPALARAEQRQRDEMLGAFANRLLDNKAGHDFGRQLSEPLTQSLQIDDAVIVRDVEVPEELTLALHRREGRSEVLLHPPGRLGVSMHPHHVVPVRFDGERRVRRDDDGVARDVLQAPVNDENMAWY